MDVVRIEDDVLDAAEHRHGVQVANEKFETRLVSLSPAQATGQGLIEALGYRPADDFIVLRYRPDGSLEEIGLEMPFDLDESRENIFFVIKASRTFNLVIDSVRLTWTEAIVTGLTIKRLGRCVAQDVEVLLERKDGPPRYIADNEEVCLDPPGVERFLLRPALEVEIKVNNKPVRIKRGFRTGAEIKAAAIAQGVKIQPSFTLSEDLPDGGSKIIGDNDPVLIKGGEEFLAIDDHDDSADAQ